MNMLLFLHGKRSPVHRLWKPQNCIQRPGKQYRKKSFLFVMTPYVSTKRVFWHLFFPFSFPSSAVSTLWPPSLSFSPSQFFSLSQFLPLSQPLLWCLGLIVLRGLEVMRVYCCHWIDETQSEMTKTPFFLVCSILQYLPLQLSLP